MSIKKMLLISLITVLSNTSLAGPVYLIRGEQAPYVGYLFTEDETKNLRKELIDKDALVGLNKSYIAENGLLKESLDFRNQQVKQLLEEYNNMETRKYLYVAGGILATIVTIYAATKVVQATK